MAWRWLGLAVSWFCRGQRAGRGGRARCGQIAVLRNGLPFNRRARSGRQDGKAVLCASAGSGYLEVRANRSRVSNRTEYRPGGRASAPEPAEAVLIGRESIGPYDRERRFRGTRSIRISWLAW